MTAGLYRLTDHVCRECLARIVERMDGPEAGTYRCSMCGVTTSAEVESICACGLHLKTGPDMRFRCVHNHKRSQQFPYELAVRRIAPGEDERLIQQVLPVRHLLD
jgi:hypothetical protein